MDDAERYATEFVLKLLKKRLFSSPRAFAHTLEQHTNTLQTARRQRAITRPSLGVLRRRLDDVQAEYENDDEYEAQTSEVVDSASRLFRDLSADERRLLGELRQYADGAANRPDSKAETLICWLRETVKPDGEWNRERVIIFTEYRDTQKWLQELLSSEGFTAGGRLRIIYGGMDGKEREEIKAAFQADPAISPVRILLATDAASEGIDLQNHCCRLIHFEIPWNPNRMEQRNGRIDRHGQKAKVVNVYHFVGQGFYKQAASSVLSPGDLEGDLEFLMRAAIRVDNIREDLGKVGPVIATQVEEAMLGRRKRLDTHQAEDAAKEVRKVYTFERNLRDQVAKLYDQLQETKRELRLSPDNIHAVVSAALALADQPPLLEATLPGVWPDPTGHRKHCPVFTLPPLRGSWALCSDGLMHPHTKHIRPITFDHSVAAGRDDVVLVHLNHRLVAMAMRLLRAEIWSTESRKRLQRVTARLVPDHIMNTPALIAHGRLVVLGGDNHRLHEEVIAAGGYIKAGRFNRMNVGQVRDALQAMRDDEAPEAVKTQLATLWPQLADPLLKAIEARMRDRTANLDDFLNERAGKEIEDITSRLEELERSIRAELHTPADPQLSLWPSAEREQLERNRESLHARLERIPEEIVLETQHISDRYANPTPRLFPVSVMLLVPARIAQQ